MISFENIKKKFEDYGYYATNELLLYYAYNALLLFDSSEISSGQDIYAICLEGPPGAGKTEFAKTYTKLANNLFNNVELVDYQCDKTTGKQELYEDIDIVSVVTGEAEKIRIPGKFIEAIKRVNDGKKVVLFIDEYDKAREETDAFFLQFLQSGKINSTQHGDLTIKEEYKGNLQVILCKNDMREELSGPLERRIRRIVLDYMKPSIFYKVATRQLIENRENPVNDGLINLVSLMYQKAYDDRKVYNRLPSCSEMLIAIEDADRLIKCANAPQHIIYEIIISNMFKSDDDIKTFESSLDKMKNQDESTLSALVKSMKIIKDEKNEEQINLNELIASKVFKDESEKLVQKVEQLESLIKEYKEKFKLMEDERKKTIDDEISKIKLENGKLISTNDMPNVINNFADESNNIKRGYNIFSLSDGNWTEVVQISKRHLSHSFVIQKLVENANSLDIKIYENGILLKEDAEEKLIAVIEMVKDRLNDDFNIEFKLLSSNPVMPSTYLVDIKNFINFIDEAFKIQPKTTVATVDTLTMGNGVYNIDALIYNDTKLDFDEETKNVYHVLFDESLEKDNDKLSQLINKVSCKDIKKAIEISKKLTSNNKVKKL